MQATFPTVSTAWLCDHLDSSDIVILESSVYLERGTASSPGSKFRSGRVEFLTEGRIPNARFADLFEAFSDPGAPLPFTRPTRQQFDAAASALGIRPDTHVVIYDRLAGQWASRLWWVFKTFGHQKVSVLDGGFKKYRSESRSVEMAPPLSFERADYRSAGTDEFVAFRSDIKDIVQGHRPASLVCLLNPQDYAGTISVRSRAGHIPGSVNVPFTELLDSKDNTLRDAGSLRRAFETAVPLDGRLIITYCGGGIASTLGALALAVIGYTNTREYDGSLVDWIDDPEAPLELG